MNSLWFVSVTGRIVQILVIEAYLGFTINSLANLYIDIRGAEISASAHGFHLGSQLYPLQYIRKMRALIICFSHVPFIHWQDNGLIPARCICLIEVLTRKYKGRWVDPYCVNLLSCCWLHVTQFTLPRMKVEAYWIGMVDFYHLINILILHICTWNI